MCKPTYRPTHVWHYWSAELNWSCYFNKLVDLLITKRLTRWRSMTGTSYSRPNDSRCPSVRISVCVSHANILQTTRVGQLLVATPVSRILHNVLAYFSEIELSQLWLLLDANRKSGSLRISAVRLETRNTVLPSTISLRHIPRPSRTGSYCNVVRPTAISGIAFWQS